MKYTKTRLNDFNVHAYRHLVPQREVLAPEVGGGAGPRLLFGRKLP
jgi:hypothetical protein